MVAEALNSLNATMGAACRAVAVHTNGLPSHVFVIMPHATTKADAYWFARCTAAHGYEPTWFGVRNHRNLFKLEEVVQPEAFE